MSVNKYKIIRASIDKQIDIPIEIKWDSFGQEQDLQKFQEDTVEKAIGVPKDFELARFQNKQYVNSFDTTLNHNFYFFTGASVTSSITSDWSLTYNSQGFTNQEIYYTTKPFLKSFFKIDFYDTNQKKTQKNYFTIILPANQSQDELKLISTFLPQVNISIPKYKLDYVKQKEGYFIYWLKSKEFYNLDTFYVSAKFFNGSTGQFVRMINTNQADPKITFSKFNFKDEIYFYYKIKLDYSDFTYQFFDYKTGTDIRVGSESNPINWYEYINPS
jgi:hypothetical protein